MKFDARNLARGWLAVTLASGDDAQRPALYRSVCIEAYEQGVRLVATDSYVLLHSWVHVLGDDETDVPGLDEVPERTVVAVDPHKRGQGLLAHLLKLATAKDAPSYDVELLFDVEGDGVEDGVLAGMAAECVALEHPDHERVLLPLYDGKWPSWRAVVAGFRAVRTSAVALNPEIVGRLARLGRYCSGPLRWEWGGAEKPAAVSFDSVPPVAGLVMPMRADWGEVDEAAAAPLDGD